VVDDPPLFTCFVVRDFFFVKTSSSGSLLEEGFDRLAIIAVRYYGVVGLPQNYQTPNHNKPANDFLSSCPERQQLQGGSLCYHRPSYLCCGGWCK